MSGKPRPLIDTSHIGDSEYTLTTSEFAKLNRVKSTSVRQQLYRSGSYFGVVPVRHANRYLLWPAVRPLAEQQPRGGK